MPHGGRLAEVREALPVRCTNAVETVVSAWVPHSVRDTDPAALTAVLREARSLAATLGPETAMTARRLLWALAPFGVWTHQTVGSFSADTLNARWGVRRWSDRRLRCAFSGVRGWG